MQFPVETFVRWPLTGNEQMPAIPSSMPVIMGVCRRKQSSYTYNKVNNEQKSVLQEKLKTIADINQLDYSSKIIKHYVEEFSDYNNVKESMEKV